MTLCFLSELLLWWLLLKRLFHFYNSSSLLLFYVLKLIHFCLSNQRDAQFSHGAIFTKVGAWDRIFLMSIWWCRNLNYLNVGRLLSFLHYSGSGRIWILIQIGCVGVSIWIDVTFYYHIFALPFPVVSQASIHRRILHTCLLWRHIMLNAVLLWIFVFVARRLRSTTDP